MELHQLEYFVAVAEERSFTAGARRAQVVQSAASTAVRRLETEFGVDLFARTGRAVELTDAGRSFLTDAREVLAAARGARERLEERAHGLRGTVTVGTLLSTGTLDLAASLGEFHRRHPGVLVQLRHSPGHYQQHLTAIRRGLLDLAIVLVPDQPPEGVRVDPVSVLNPIAIASRAHPLADRIRLTLSDLAGETFIDFPPGWGNREETDALFRQAGVDRTVAIESTDITSTHALVAGGLGIAFVPAGEGPPSDGLVRLDLAEPVPEVRMGIATTARRRLSPASDELRRSLLGLV